MFWKEYKLYCVLKEPAVIAGSFYNVCIKNDNIALKVINKNVDNFCFYIKTTYFFTKKTTKRGKNLFFYQICLVFVGFGVDFCVVLIYNKHNQ